MNEFLNNLISKLESDAELIGSDRKKTLIELAGVLYGALQSSRYLDVTIICSHNSRRSQLAQLWLELGIAYFQIEKCRTYSGGTEATAFNPRMVKAIKDFGILIKEVKSGDNPIYEVDSLSHGVKSQYFSKVYHEYPNPKSDFVAILVCSDAEQACPLVIGASNRFYLPYTDPKLSDGTELESETYLNKVLEIGREMIFLLKDLKFRIESSQN